MMQQRRTPNNMAEAPPLMPPPMPWIHSTTSRTSLAGLEIGLPPSPALSERDMSHERPPSRLDKALPPVPRPERPEQLQENTTAYPTRNPFLSAPESNAPLIPQKNPRRFSWVGSNVSPTSSSPLRPLTRTSSTVQSISNSSARPSASLAAPLPPSDWRKNPSAPPPLKHKHAISFPYHTNKIAQLTGYDLFAEFSPIRYQRPRFESEASICRSLYSGVSPTTIISRETKHSDDSISSIVDSYSDWDSWAPSSPLTSPLLPPTPGLKMDSGVAPEDVGSTSTITAESNTRAPVPPPVPPPRNRTRDLGPPSDEVVGRSGLRSPKRATTLEDLIEHERTQLENGYKKEPPLSPLAQIAALQLKRDSGIGSSVDDRIGRSAVRPQASLPTMPNSYHLHHVRSVSKFSDSGSDDDNASVHSVASFRIRDGAKSVRDSFVRGLSGLSRPTSRREDSNTRSRLSNLSDRDTARASRRTSDTSATTLSPAPTNSSHKHRYTLSASTTRSSAISFERLTSATNTDAQKSNTRDSGFSRSWTSAFRKPFRSSRSTHRSESGLERRKSKKHSRMVSAPAKYHEDIRKVTPRIVLLPGQACAPHGFVDLSESKRHKVALLPEEIVAAAKLAAEYANRQEDEESLSSVEQSTAVTLGRRFSITGRGGKVVGTKDTTALPPSLPMSDQANLGVPLIHVPVLEERKEAEKRTEEGTMKGRFSVRAMLGREFVSFKAKAGIRSREEKKREQLKGLIRVVEVEDEKQKTEPKKPCMPLGETPQAPGRIEKEQTERAEDNPGLADEEMSSAAQMWL